MDFHGFLTLVACAIYWEALQLQKAARNHMLASEASISFGLIKSSMID
jgi:hypothetical protein